MDAEGIAKIIAAFGEWGIAGLLALLNFGWLAAFIYGAIRLVRPCSRIADALEDIAEKGNG